MIVDDRIVFSLACFFNKSRTVGIALDRVSRSISIKLVGSAMHGSQTKQGRPDIVLISLMEYIYIYIEEGLFSLSIFQRLFSSKR